MLAPTEDSAALKEVSVPTQVTSPAEFSNPNRRKVKMYLLFAGIAQTDPLVEVIVLQQTSPSAPPQVSDLEKLEKQK
tara:strand:+ start:1478 stop:1708 length:231 start_codon:yes stop_codon:yes gene_type:complete